MACGEHATREWFDRLEKGHVVDLNGSIRTVRRVSRTSDGLVSMVAFAKLRRSRFESSYTWKTRAEVRDQLRGVYGRRTDGLRSTEAEAAVQDEIECDGACSSGGQMCLPRNHRADQKYVGDVW